MGKTLVVSYSDRGHTRDAARAVAQGLDADLEELKAPGLIGGWLGFWQRLWRILRDRPVEIAPPREDPSRYDRVVLCAPVWAEQVASPMQSYLRGLKGRLPDLALVLTSRSGQDAKAFAQMERLSGRRARARLSLSLADRLRGTAEGKLAVFLSELRSEMAETEQRTGPKAERSDRPAA